MSGLFRRALALYARFTPRITRYCPADYPPECPTGCGGSAPALYPRQRSGNADLILCRWLYRCAL